MGISSYQVDWQAKSIIHQGFDKDDRGFGVIDYLLDFCRCLKTNYNLSVDTISCSKNTKNGIIKAYAEWSKCDCGIRGACEKENAIQLDGSVLKFDIIPQENVIYLVHNGSVSQKDYDNFREKVLSLWSDSIDWDKIPALLYPYVR